MIKLTKFTGEEFFINPETIKFVEDCGDTVLTLITGDRILVRESASTIRDAFLAYKREAAGAQAFPAELTYVLDP